MLERSGSKSENPNSLLDQHIESFFQIRGFSKRLPERQLGPSSNFSATSEQERAVARQFSDGVEESKPHSPEVEKQQFNARRSAAAWEACGETESEACNSEKGIGSYLCCCFTIFVKAPYQAVKAYRNYNEKNLYAGPGDIKMEAQSSKKKHTPYVSEQDLENPDAHLDIPFQRL